SCCPIPSVRALAPCAFPLRRQRVRVSYWGLWTATATASLSPTKWFGHQSKRCLRLVRAFRSHSVRQRHPELIPRSPHHAKRERLLDQGCRNEGRSKISRSFSRGQTLGSRQSRLVTVSTGTSPMVGAKSASV